MSIDGQPSTNWTSGSEWYFLFQGRYLREPIRSPRRILDLQTVVWGRCYRRESNKVQIKMEQGPPKAADFRIHQTLQEVHLYLKQLTELGQPAFCQDPVPELTEWYRFLWVPTFDHPVFLSRGYCLRWRGYSPYARLERPRWLRMGKFSKTWKLRAEEQVDLSRPWLTYFWSLPSEVEGFRM